MAFIDCVEWQPQINDIFAWRYPEQNLTTATQLIVRESQEGVFFYEGQIIGKFGPGKHTLSIENFSFFFFFFFILFFVGVYVFGGVSALSRSTISSGVSGVSTLAVTMLAASKAA